MTFTVEDWSGVDDANAYITVAYFKAHHDLRANDYASLITTDPDDIEVAIVKATDYMEMLYGDRWKGRLADEATTLQFPRDGMYDRKGKLVDAWPSDIQKACAEYAFRALSGELMPDPEVLDDTGLIITSKTEKVGPIEESTSYSAGATKIRRDYPEADRLLHFWLTGTGGVIR